MESRVEVTVAITNRHRLLALFPVSSGAVCAPNRWPHISVPMTTVPAANAPNTKPQSHAFGRYTLRRLLGKGVRTMSWLAFDPTTSTEVMLTMPRVSAVGANAQKKWTDASRRAARLDHPHIAPVGEMSVHENWPFIAVDRGVGITLEEWLAVNPPSSVDIVAGWLCDVLRALAFAHESSVVHGDLQLHNLLINERGEVILMGLNVAIDAPAVSAQIAPTPPRAEPVSTLDALQLRSQRAAAERDVLACGVLLTRLLSGTPPFDEPDVARVIDRLAPLGRDIIALAWTTPLPVPEALRAITRRSTSAQPRLRYRGARTFLGALQSWRAAVADDDGGPVALLLDRLRTVGHLPALPGLAMRVQRLLAVDGQRTGDIASHLLPDLALSFELLRTLHTAQVQGTQVPGNGPVLTLRRVVALIGVNGVRQSANSLRTWPGPLDDVGAGALKTLFDRVRLAGHVAQALRPAGYDTEVVYLVTALQNLSRLMLRYHFADEAAQIHELTLSVKEGDGADAVEKPGLTEDVAAHAVLGVDIEAFGEGVARAWGLDPVVQHMIRRLSIDHAVRKPDGDADVLRMLGSAANEAVDVISTLPSSRIAAALAVVAQRYNSLLKIDTKTIQDALNEARNAVRGTVSDLPRGGRSQTTVEAGVNAAENYVAPPPEVDAEEPADTARSSLA